MNFVRQRSCGSWARGNPRHSSDRDLLIIARNPKQFRRNQKWIGELEFEEAGVRYVDHETATYGAAWSAHIELEPAARRQLTLAGASWACPIDSGTKHDITDTFKILVDKDGP